MNKRSGALRAREELFVVTFVFDYCGPPLLRNFDRLPLFSVERDQYDQPVAAVSPSVRSSYVNGMLDSPRPPIL